MPNKYDLPEIRRRYKELQEEAERNGRLFLSYDVENWIDKLNEVEKRIFQDLRVLGLPLYPIFPYSDDQYMHFANPFKKIGIEIIFKNSPTELIQRKVKLLESAGWTVYTINSENTYYPIEDFFQMRRKDGATEWEDLDGDQAFRFAEKYKSENAPSLLYYLRQRYFDRVVESW